MTTKLISWNVNGIRSALGKGFMDFFQTAAPDVLCIQETKANQDQVELALDGYHLFWNSAQKKGYSGTAIFSRLAPIHVSLDLGIEKHDKEGRVITLEFDHYFLVNVYTPNSQNGLTRLAYRTQEWDVDFLAYINRLEAKKPVIFCGDLNVAHKAIDLKNPKSNVRNAGFTIEERNSFDRYIEAGYIDTFREFTKEGGHYTWWSYMAGARARNIGWRIDYFCISPRLRPRLLSANILPHVLGSDHCPVEMVLS